MSKSGLLDKIAVALGGRAAEEIEFKDVSNGSHNDLARATDIARSMVKEYGMSGELGHIYFEKDRQKHLDRLIREDEEIVQIVVKLIEAGVI